MWVTDQVWGQDGWILAKFFFLRVYGPRLRLGLNQFGFLITSDTCQFFLEQTKHFQISFLQIFPSSGLYDNHTIIGKRLKFDIPSNVFLNLIDISMETMNKKNQKIDNTPQNINLADTRCDQETIWSNIKTQEWLQSCFSTFTKSLQLYDCDYNFNSQN